MTGIRGVSVILWSPGDDRFTTSASTVPGQSAHEASRRVRRDGATNWVVTHGLPIVVNDVDHDPFGANAMLAEHDCRAYAGLPVQDDGETFGVLYVMAGERDHFRPSDVRFLSIVADRCAVAIRSSAAGQRTRELLERSRALAAITASLVSLEPLDRRVKSSVDHLAAALRGSVRTVVHAPDGDLDLASDETPSRREDEAERRVSATADDITVVLSLRPGRSSPSEDESREVLLPTAEQIAMSAARDHATRAVVASNRALEQFAHVASHDLKAPLSSVIGFVDLALTVQDDTISADVRTLLERALAGGHRMQGIIDALLAYAKIEMADIEREDVALGAIVDEVLADLAAAIEASGGTVAVADDLPELRVERATFGLVLQNLIANAVRFTRTDEPPSITVAGRIIGDEVEMTVEDRGPGVRPEDRERVFDLFERSGNGVRGGGIGLATVRRIVRLHSGRVWLEAAEPHGTRAVVRVPRT